MKKFVSNWIPIICYKRVCVCACVFVYWRMLFKGGFFVLVNNLILAERWLKFVRSEITKNNNFLAENNNKKKILKKKQEKPEST